MSREAHVRPSPGSPTLQEPWDDPIPPGGWLARVLSIPLFHKLQLAHLALMLIALALAVAAATWLRAAIPSESVSFIIAFALAAAAFSTGLHAMLLRSALRPIDRLEAVAHKVGNGALDARVDHSPLADRSLLSLTRTFNWMLDRVEGARLRERDLALRVLAAEERERDRLAGELYAGPCQTMAGLLVRLQLASRGHEGRDKVLDELRDQVGGALEEIRAVAHRLSPPEMNELGVVPALESHARRITDGRLVRVSFRGAVFEDRLTQPVRVALFRIVREALSNAVYHAGATRINISLSAFLETLEVEIQDDGKGFDVEATMNATHGNVGLLGMRERAAYAAGTLTIESAPSVGTVVRIVLPLSAERPATDPSASAVRHLRPPIRTVVETGT